MNKISAVYKITNTITGDFYIGSSNDIKRRWVEHKKPSTWKKCPNIPMYKDMNELGLDKFDFQVITEAESCSLRELEQQFIETLQPTYNNYNANGLNIERLKEYNKEYNKEYKNQLCSFNGQTITLNALSMRFRRRGLSNSTAEAKKYIIKD